MPKAPISSGHKLPWEGKGNILTSPPQRFYRGMKMESVFRANESPMWSALAEEGGGHFDSPREQPLKWIGIAFGGDTSWKRGLIAWRP